MTELRSPDEGEDNHDDELSDCLGEAQAWHQMNLVEIEQNEVSNEEWISPEHGKQTRVRVHLTLVWINPCKMDPTMGDVDQTSGSESMIDEIGLEF